MAKVKVSEWSATPGSNTDIDGINLAEGCAPSGINDAIREMMSQIKDWQSGASGDSLTIGAAGTLTLSGGTANGIPYLNGSKVLTSGSALTFDGTNLVLGTGGTSGGFPFTQRVAASGSPVSALRITNSSDSTFDVTLQTSLASIGNGIGSLAFLQAGTEAMRLTSTGLGIGTSLPAGKLHVNGSVVVDSYMDFRNAGSTKGNIYVDASNMYINTQGTNTVLNGNGGNLGLGVTPSAWQSTSGSRALQFSSGAIYGYQTAEIDVLYNTYYDGAFKYLNTGYATQYSQGFNGTHRWFTAPSGTAGNAISFTQAMTLDASGNLLVGTTNALDSAGIGLKYIQSAAQPQLAMVGSSSSNANFTYTLYSTGAGAYRFYVGYGGTISATSTSITALSDITLKENIRDLETGLTEVMAMRPRRFDWKEETQINERNVAGFIAQELEGVMPELVYDYKYNAGENKRAIKMGDILPTLVKAIQEQQAIIEQLKADVAALKAAP